MFLVTIGAVNYADNVINFIYSQMDNLKQEGFDILCEHYYAGKNVFIRCALKDNLLTRLTDKKTYDDFRFYISQMVAEVIIENWEDRLVKKIIKYNYFYLEEKEKDTIYKTVQRLLQEDKGLLPDGFYTATRRNKIMREIIEYLENNDTLNIDGFVNFRLSSYIKELNENVEKAIEIYIAEREYNEFIKLLKYFVEIQEPKIDTVHLMCTEEGKYLLLDGHKNKINGEFFDEIKADISEGDINYDDLLISTLITVSPRKIYIHDLDSFTNKELIKTITNVFSDRISICIGCETCSTMVRRETNNYSLY